MSKGTFRKGKKDKITKKDKVKVKAKLEKFLAIILKQNKSASFEWIPFSDNEFRCDGNTYFSVPEGLYLSKKRLVLGVYLEGISTPLSHRNVKKKQVERTIIGQNGEKETITVDMIEGLKYDSEIIDILLNRGLASKFTEMPQDRTLFVVAVLVIIGIIATMVSIGVEFI